MYPENFAWKREEEAVKGRGNLRKKSRIVFLCLLLLVTVFAVPRTAMAAKKVQMNVRVDKSYGAVLEKRGADWYLVSEKSGFEHAKYTERIRYLTVKAGSGLKSGYYYFDRAGKLDSRKVFHTLDTKVMGHRFKGVYYFGGDHARLWCLSGKRIINGKQYYLSSMGKRFQDCWKAGYYYKSNGVLAKSMALPDGTYVDCDGRKCKKEEMRLSRLKKTLKTMGASYGGQWSVYVKNLKTGDELVLNDIAMYPASVIKLFAMESTYDRIYNGKLKKTSYINGLLYDMITVSDNDAYNELIRLNSASGSFLSGCSNVNKYLKKKGYTKTSCHSTLHPSDTPYTTDGSKNTSSARDAGLLLEKIYRGKCVSREYSSEMLNLLLRQTRRWKIPAGLPAGTKVANKTGETSSSEHDTAIVFGPKADYVVCIFSQYSRDGIYGVERMSSVIYNYLNK